MVTWNEINLLWERTMGWNKLVIIVRLNQRTVRNGLVKCWELINGLMMYEWGHYPTYWSIYNKLIVICLYEHVISCDMCVRGLLSLPNKYVQSSSLSPSPLTYCSPLPQMGGMVRAGAWGWQYASIQAYSSNSTTDTEESLQHRKQYSNSLFRNYILFVINKKFNPH